jgi:hypothetical protein
MDNLEELECAKAIADRLAFNNGFYVSFDVKIEADNIDFPVYPKRFLDHFTKQEYMGTNEKQKDYLQRVFPSAKKFQSKDRLFVVEEKVTLEFKLNSQIRNSDYGDKYFHYDLTYDGWNNTQDQDLPEDVQEVNSTSFLDPFIRIYDHSISASCNPKAMEAFMVRAKRKSISLNWKALGRMFGRDPEEMKESFEQYQLRKMNDS